MSERYQIEHLDDISLADCPCGRTRRAFVDDVDRAASMHVVEICVGAKTHKQTTELYYILDGVR